MRHCVHCDRPVRPIKKLSWGLLVFFVVITFIFQVLGVLLIIGYLGYYAQFKRKECPICRGKDFTLTREQAEEDAYLDSVRMSKMFKK